MERNGIGIKNATKRRLKYELGINLENIKELNIVDSFLYKAIDKNKKYGESECKIKRWLSSYFEIRYNAYFITKSRRNIIY